MILGQTVGSIIGKYEKKKGMQIILKVDDIYL